MKKGFKFITAVLALVMVAVMFIGCSEQAAPASAAPASSAPAKSEAASQAAPSAESAAPAKADGKQLVFGLSLPTQAQERWVRDKANMENFCKEKGIDLRVQCSNDDATKQLAQCENLLSQGIDVLILAPHDAKAAAAIVEKAKDVNVPVISYDRLVLDSEYVLYVSFDNYSIGEIQGQYLVDNLPKGNVILLQGAPSDNNAKLFYQGAMSKIQPKIDSGDYKVIADQPIDKWSADNCLKIMENALTLCQNNVQGVLSPADSMTSAAVEALAAQKLDGKVIITGQDADLAAIQKIVAGTQSMTVLKDTRKLGIAALEAAIKIAKGEKVETTKTVNNGKIDVPSLLLTPVMIDKSNLDKEVIDSGYLSKDDVYGKK